MGLSLKDRLSGKGKRNICPYDFSEARPFWKMWWFRIAVLAMGIFLPGFFRATLP